DLCYAKSFKMKEPGENPLSMMPKFMADYTELHFNVSLTNPDGLRKLEAYVMLLSGWALSLA
ncbi:MAG: hypothetical protein Q9198_010311, partial [Flavoplaca austrocitrina]